MVTRQVPGTPPASISGHILHIWPDCAQVNTGLSFANSILRSCQRIDMLTSAKTAAERGCAFVMYIQIIIDEDAHYGTTVSMPCTTRSTYVCMCVRRCVCLDKIPHTMLAHYCQLACELAVKGSMTAGGAFVTLLSELRMFYVSPVIAGRLLPIQRAFDEPG